MIWSRRWEHLLSLLRLVGDSKLQCPLYIPMFRGNFYIAAILPLELSLIAISVGDDTITCVAALLFDSVNIRSAVAA